MEGESGEGGGRLRTHGSSRAAPAVGPGRRLGRHRVGGEGEAVTEPVAVSETSHLPLGLQQRSAASRKVFCATVAPARGRLTFHITVRHKTAASAAVVPSCISIGITV